jgi:transcriptional regulator with XRE-family HTH domain
LFQYFDEIPPPSHHGIMDPQVGKAGVVSAESGTTRTMSEVGALVQQLRHEAQLSIAALAERAQLSTGLLSQIERGIGNPSFTTLIKLSQALQVSVGRFFGGPDRAGSLVRREDRRRLMLSETDLVYELLTPHMHGQLGMIKAHIAAGWSNEQAPFVHEGEECITVTEGELVVCISSTQYTITEGDSLTYNSSLPHWYRNETAHHAVLIGAMTPPSF